MVDRATVHGQMTKFWVNVVGVLNGCNEGGGHEMVKGIGGMTIHAR